MKYLIVVLAILFVTACDVNPSEFGTEEAVHFANKITYVKDQRTELCFALVASRKTGDWNQSGLGMSVVPCEKVEKWTK